MWWGRQKRSRFDVGSWCIDGEIFGVGTRIIGKGALAFSERDRDGMLWGSLCAEGRVVGLPCGLRRKRQAIFGRGGIAVFGRRQRFIAGSFVVFVVLCRVCLRGGGLKFLFEIAMDIGGCGNGDGIGVFVIAFPRGIRGRPYRLGERDGRGERGRSGGCSGLGGLGGCGR